MLGRQGNVLLVNGLKRPSLEVASASRERWRLVNSANGRYFNLSLPGSSLLVIAWDGGLLPEPYEVESLLIAPGERYEVLVTIDAMPGTRLELKTSHYDRGHNVPDPGPKALNAWIVSCPPIGFVRLEPNHSHAHARPALPPCVSALNDDGSQAQSIGRL